MSSSNSVRQAWIIALTVALLTSASLFSESRPSWLADLKSPDFQTRSDALTQLEKSLQAGRADRDVILALLEAGDERDHVLRMHVDALYELVPPSAIPILVDALENESAVVRASAATALGVLGPPSKEALPRLLGLLQDTNDKVRWNAGFAIGKIDTGVGSTLPALITMLKSQSLQDRLTAARTLDELGVVAARSLADVLAAFEDPDENLRYRLVIVLGNLPASHPGVLSKLLQLLAADPSAFVRGRVAREFWEMGLNKEPEAAQGVTALADTLSDPSPNVALQAVKALQAIGTPSKAALPKLESCAKGESKELAVECRKALRSFAG